MSDPEFERIVDAIERDEFQLAHEARVRRVRLNDEVEKALHRITVLVSRGEIKGLTEDAANAIGVACGGDENMSESANRYPWVEETTKQAFGARLSRAGGRLKVRMKSGEDLIAVKVGHGVVYFEGGGNTRLSKLVWTPLGYLEISSDETDLQKRAAEALSIMDRHIDIAELDSPRNPLAILNKRLKEEQEAQQKAGTTEFQTLDPLTEKVIASWLRDLGEGDLDPYQIASRIEDGEHRRQ